MRYCTGCSQWYHAICLGHNVKYSHVVRHVKQQDQRVYLRTQIDVDSKNPTFEALARLPIVRRARKPEVCKEDGGRDQHCSPLSLEVIITHAIKVVLDKTQGNYPDIWAWCLDVQEANFKDKNVELMALTKVAVGAALAELRGEDVSRFNDDDMLRATFDVNRWFECPTCTETAFL